MAAIQEQLAECQRRARAAEQAVSDPDMATRVEARSLRLAFQEEAADLGKKLGYVQAERLAPAQRRLAAARDRAERARSAVEDLTAAIASPFLTEAGTSLPPWFSYSVYSGSWFTDLQGQAAEDVITFAAAASRLADRWQREAIRAYVAGDPQARAALKGAGTHRTVDGDEVSVLEDGTPVVTRQPASRAALDAVPAQQPHNAGVDAALAELREQLNAAADGPLPGMPGFGHQAEPGWIGKATQLPQAIRDLVEGTR